MFKQKNAVGSVLSKLAGWTQPIAEVARSHLELELWFVFLCLAFLFWGVATGGTHHMLTTSTYPVQPLQIVPNVGGRSHSGLLAIRAYVMPEEGHTHVEMKTLDTPTQDEILELPFIEFDAIEGAIATHLGLPRFTIRKIVRYQIIH